MRIHDIAEKGRYSVPPFNSDRGDTFGHFRLTAPTGAFVFVIAADGTETRFDHVSVSVQREKDGSPARRCPTWEEMCFIRNLFWEPEECVIQYHPPASKYVNAHPYVLHLWKPLDTVIETPPEWTIA